MYLLMYFVFTYLFVFHFLAPANPVGIGVIYVMAPLVVTHKPTEQIPQLVNYCVKSINPLSADSAVGVCNIGGCWVCDVAGLAFYRQQTTHTSFSVCR